MRAVVQRVSRAKVTVDRSITGEIAKGLLVLVGMSVDDDSEDADYLVDKILKLRVFADDDGRMNLSLQEVAGELLVVSQFTLYADTRRGRRPSFIKAAAGDDSRRLYEYFIQKAELAIFKVETGEFGAMMDVEMVNDGPVTIILDSERTI